jgi:hypothetical protein
MTITSREAELMMDALDAIMTANNVPCPICGMGTNPTPSGRQCGWCMERDQEELALYIAENKIDTQGIRVFK